MDEAVSKDAPDRISISYSIVRALAAIPESRWDEADWCVLCESHPSHGHGKSCTWVMAREWAKRYGN
jgi:hypothetical protein